MSLPGESIQGRGKGEVNVSEMSQNGTEMLVLGMCEEQQGCQCTWSKVSWEKGYGSDVKKISRRPEHVDLKHYQTDFGFQSEFPGF